MSAERALRTRRFSKTRAKKADTCVLCTQRIRPGMPIALCYAEEAWVHVGCLVRRMNGVGALDAT